MNKTVKSLFDPDLTIQSLDELNILLPEFREKGIRLLIFDVDQTLVQGKEKTISQQARRLIEKARALDFFLVAASNNFSFHKKELEKLRLDGLYFFCLKPLPFLFRRLQKRFQIKPEEMVIIGDQRLTDIAAGNLAGALSVLNTADKKEMRVDQKLIDFIETRLIKKNRNKEKGGRS